MRSCAYCGKELAAGEQCDCPSAVNARNAKKQSEEPPKTENKKTEQKQNTGYQGWQNDSYTTGYTQKEKKGFKDFFKKKDKFGEDFKGAASDINGFAKRFMLDPINTVSNPRTMGWAHKLIILIVTALSVSFCSVMAYTRLIGNFSFMANIFGQPVYKIGNVLLNTLTGSLSVLLIMFLYLGILFLINKYIMRSTVKFSDFITRPIAAMVPLMVFSLIAAIINFFTIYGTVMILLTGIIMWIILTYEAMRSEWSFAPARRVFYITSIAFFVLFVVVFNLIRFV